ncbi:MAG: EamA family transporter [Spirochaetia bacterium]|jgi:chloramphenicol-sensitive protein RarD|nr:EamA family transporter [Spirochaetia bacterium]
MNNKNYGLVSILFVYTVWGIQALYWKLFQEIPLLSILAWRIVCSFIILSAVLIAAGKFNKIFIILKSPQILLRTALCAFLIAFNWLLNIYAAYSNQLVESSLGHYITPIIVICSGIFILKEKVKYYEAAALLIALTGVLYLAIITGKIPLIAVFLIITFAGYTFLKKHLILTL